MLVEYARVYRDDQILEVQRDALVVEGCERIFKDVTSGAGARPGLRAALGCADAGDTLVVWRLDRFGRSLKDLIAPAEGLRNRGVGLRSVKEGIDTSSRAGRPVASVFRALAESKVISDESVQGQDSAPPVREGGSAGGESGWVSWRGRTPLRWISRGNIR